MTDEQHASITSEEQFVAFPHLYVDKVAGGFINISHTLENETNGTPVQVGMFKPFSQKQQQPKKHNNVQQTHISTARF